MPHSIHPHHAGLASYRSHLMAAAALAVVLAGCGGSPSSSGPTHSASPPAAGAPRLPIDDAEQHPLAPGPWQTQAGFPVRVSWRISTRGWVGAHRSSDLSWQLRSGPPTSGVGGYLEVDVSTDTAGATVASLRHTRGLEVHSVTKMRLDGKPATVLDTVAARPLTLDPIGGFKPGRGEIERFYVLALPQTTIVIDEGDPSPHDFRTFAPRAAQVLRTVRFG